MGWLQCRLSFVCLWFNTSVIPAPRYVVWDHRTATRHFEFRAGGPWWWEWKSARTRWRRRHFSRETNMSSPFWCHEIRFTCFLTSFKTECTFFWQNNYGCSNRILSGIKQPRFLSFYFDSASMTNSLFNLLCFNFFNIFFASHLSFSKSRRWRFCPS